MNALVVESEGEVDLSDPCVRWWEEVNDGVCFDCK